MPIFWRSKIILAKKEVTYGVDPTLTGAANALLLSNVNLSPMEGEDVSAEEDLPYMGNQSSAPSALRMRLQASVNLQGSGTAGVAPAWSPLMIALGCSETVVANTSVTYRPISDSHSSVYFKMWIGDTLYAFKGARGTGTLRFAAQGLPKLDIDIQGLFIKPSQAARPSPVTLTAFKKAKVVSAANTPVFLVNSVPLILRELTMNLGNQVEPSLLVPTEEILIVDRAETISARVRAVALSIYDPFALALDEEATVPVALTHGNVAGRIISFTAPTCQQARLSGLENQQNIKEWPLSLKPLPATGDDQWALALT